MEHSVRAIAARNLQRCPWARKSNVISNITKMQGIFRDVHAIQVNHFLTTLTTQCWRGTDGKNIWNYIGKKTIFERTPSSVQMFKINGVTLCTCPSAYARCWSSPCDRFLSPASPDIIKELNIHEVKLSSKILRCNSLLQRADLTRIIRPLSLLVVWRTWPEWPNLNDLAWMSYKFSDLRKSINDLLLSL